VYSGHLFLLVVHIFVFEKYTLRLVGIFFNHLGLLFVLFGMKFKTIFLSQNFFISRNAFSYEIYDVLIC